MKGKTVLITGATSGIGKETAIGLAKLGATIVFTSRDKKRGEQAKKDIIATSGNSNVDYIFCDLSSFDSVRSCCHEFKTRHKSLHILINNAGIWNFSRKDSKDNIEETFAVNYLAPFLMTTLLLDILKKSSPSKIISVSSGLHKRGKMNFDNIEFKKSYSGIGAYSQSKLALILFTKHLAHKLEGTGVTANCVHPGFVSTNLGRDSGLLAGSAFRMFGKSPKEGAETSIYVASAKDLETVTGEYFVDKKIAHSSKASHDMDSAEKLWDLSAKYVHLKK